LHSESEEHRYWHKNVFIAPNNLNYWLDFLDTDESAGLNQFSVSAIGARTKVDNNSKPTAIFYKDIPNVLLLSENSSIKNSQLTGYDKLRLSQAKKNLFSKSSAFLSTKDVADTLLYNHAHCAESITINCIPVYYL
jgi:hypothetical protein